MDAHALGAYPDNQAADGAAGGRHPPPDVFTSPELLALQLVAVGYSPAQIDALLEADGATRRAIRGARAALGVVGLALVLDDARRRALILLGGYAASSA